MKLWLLRPIDPDAENGPWDPWFDKNFGLVVRAETEDRARQLAAENAGDEQRGEFLGVKKCEPGSAWSSQWSTCVELTSDGEEEVVIIDHHAA